MSRPLISVVVPTRERPDRLATLVQSLEGQTLAPDRFEVVLVDDGSETPVGVREDVVGALRLRVLRHEQTRGPGAARNTGWRSAHADLVAFTDDDCRATPGWLEGLLARLDSDHVIVQGRTEPDPDERDRLGPFSLTREVYGPNGVHETCNIAYPKSVLARVGGFDESYRLCAEDVDLGWRARKSGARMEFADDAIVYHAVTNPSLAGLVAHIWRQRDNARVIREHPELRALLVGGVFWKPSHPALVGSALMLVAGLAASRRSLTALAPLPYAAHYLNRSARQGARPQTALRILPRHLVIDMAELATMIAGSLRHRSLVL